MGSREDGLCGKTLALNCFINRALYGIDTEPIFSWSAPDGSLVSTRESANPRIDTQSRQLYFNDISTANGGSYTCQVAVSTDNTARTSITVDTNGIYHACCTPNVKVLDLLFQWKLHACMQSPSIDLHVTLHNIKTHIASIECFM